MLVHIGNTKTLKTLCGKNVDRRYWVSITQQRHQGLTFYTGANCKCCLQNFNKKGNRK